MNIFLVIVLDLRQERKHYMTNEEVLTWARNAYYAHVDVGHDFCMYYGKARWEQRLAELSEEQRAMLVEHIERWEAMRTRVD